MLFCGALQLFFAGSVKGQPEAAPPRPGPVVAGTKRVVLVAGIYSSGRAMHFMQRYLEARGYQASAVNLRPNDGSVSFETMGRQLESYVDTNIPHGEKFDLVAFSMGGLVARYYIQRLGGYQRVRRLVTLSTPNHGTFWARLGDTAGVKQMRPDSEMLRELNGDVTKLEPLKYTSIYTPFDLSIIPATSSRMPVARNVMVWVPLHPFMVMSSRPMREVERALE